MRLIFGFVLLWAQVALAQRVVILELEGDRGGKLRNQVEAALKKAGEVEVVSLEKYKAAAARKKLKGAAAMTPAGLARVSRELKLEAGVGGEVDAKFAVQIWDSSGQQLWTKELKVKNGLLSADFAQKLAKAITAAAKMAPKPGEEEAEATEAPAPAPVAKSEEHEQKPEEQGPRAPATPKSSEEQAQAAQTEQPAEPEAVASAEPEPDQDLEQEGRKVKNRIGPKGISLWVAGTTTWRNYCARPGVSTCGEYEQLPEPKPPGDPVDFRTQVPYAGFYVRGELFPLAWVVDNLLQGLGLVGDFALGFSLTTVTIESGPGQSTAKRFVATDRTWSAMLAYRYYFSFDASAKNPAVGYLGLRAGLAGRVFEIDPNAQVPVPGTNRLYPAVGLDLAIPIVRFFGLEVGAQYFISPRPGPDEIAGFGNFTAENGGATGQGFMLQGGIAGTVWGPLGYRIQARYTAYTDQFFGPGQKWVAPNDKGAAAESYVNLLWGITASF